MVTDIKQQNIILVGFMGTGKTQVGKRLAAILNRPFVDVDEVIEHRTGQTISQIFRQQGELFFRQLEQNVIKEVTNRKGQVVALGGGAFVNPENQRVCLQDSIVMFLNSSWPTIRGRLPILRATRPVLGEKSEQEIKALFDCRLGLYKNAHVEIVTEKCGSSVEEVAQYIAGVVRKLWNADEPPVTPPSHGKYQYGKISIGIANSDLQPL